MGASLSTCDLRYCEKASADTLANYMDTLSSIRANKSRIEQCQKINNWRQVLRKELNTVSGNIPFWALFKQAATEEIINSSNDEFHLEWIINAKFVSYCFPIHPTQPLLSEDSIVGGNEIVKISMMSEVPSPTDYRDLHQTLTTQVEPSSNDERSQFHSPFFRPPKKITKKSQAVLKGMSYRSAKEELKQHLLKQIKTKNHIVNQLVRIFHLKFDELFADQIQHFHSMSYSQAHEETFQSICQLVKSFIRILRHFLKWAYQELISNFSKALDQEDLSPQYLIEYVSYEALFAKGKSTLNKLLRVLIRKKHSGEIEILKEKFRTKQAQKLNEYDAYLKASTLFTMDNDPQPYDNVTRSIYKLQFQMNPYEKFESILSLESEMIKGLEKYHQAPLKMKTVRGDFGMDLKAPIFLFCIVRSKNCDLLVDSMLIAQFVNQDFLSKVQNYMTFEACLNFLIESQELPPIKMEEKIKIMERKKNEQNNEFELKF